MWADKSQGPSGRVNYAFSNKIKTGLDEKDSLGDDLRQLRQDRIFLLSTVNGEELTESLKILEVTENDMQKHLERVCAAGKSSETQSVKAENNQLS